jgi:sporulation protein YlmC with PRC-barrel domain
MKEMPINVNVECSDGQAGTSTHVIFDPATMKITHVVVTDNKPVVEHSYLVPMDSVVETRHDVIKLDCTLAELAQMEPFIDVHYIENPGPELGYPADSVYLAPYVSPLDMDYLPVEVERIPMGELAVRRGAVVEATDGYVGKLGEFLLDPDSGQVTHLVLQEGHGFGKREITLPISAIDRTLENTIYLKLDKSGIAQLPSIPIQRDYGKSDEAVRLELLAKIFKTPEEASLALKQIKQMRREQKDLFKIHNAAVLVKDSNGQSTIKETADVSTKQGRLFGAVVGGLFGLLGGPIGVVIGALAGAGNRIRSLNVSWRKNHSQKNLMMKGSR